MKNLLVIFVAISALFACTQQNQIDGVTPEGIGVMAPDSLFTPYPNADGGEVCQFNFVIGIRLPNEIYAETVNYEAVVFLKKPGAKKEQIILEAKQAYELIKTIKAENFFVYLSQKTGEVIEIELKDQFIDGVFIPGKLLWEKNQ